MSAYSTPERPPKKKLRCPHIASQTEQTSALLFDSERQLMFVPGNLDDIYFSNNVGRLNPNVIGVAHERPELNHLAAVVLRKMEFNKVNFKDEIVYIAGRFHEDHHDVLRDPWIMGVLAKVQVSPKLPRDLLISEFIASMVKYEWLVNMYDAFERLEQVGDDDLAKFSAMHRRLCEAESADGALAAASGIGARGNTGGLPTTSMEYLAAGVNEGLPYCVALLAQIPSMLAVYRLKSQKPQPSHGEVVDFAKGQGLKWVNMHATGHRDSVFSLLDSTGVYMRSFHGVPVLHRSKFSNPGILVISDRPSPQNVPSLAYNMSTLTDDQKQHLYRFFSNRGLIAPRTTCPAFQAGMTDDLYLQVLGIMSEAGVLGYKP